MKRPLFVIVPCLLLSLMLNGCGRSYNCSDYIPDESQISWTGYNTVQQYGDYFLCHPNAMDKHYLDTIGICGWIVWENDGNHANLYEMPQEPPFELPIDGHAVHISDDSLGNNHHPIAVLENWHRVGIPESLWHKKIYVKGIVKYDDDLINAWGCCTPYACSITIIQVDSIPKE